MGISVNGPSGIDTKYIIDSLVDLEMQRVYSVEKQRDAYQVKINAYSKLQNLISDVASKAAELDEASDFDLFTETSSNEDVATISGSYGAVEAQYGVKVFQLAQNEKMVSRDNLITDQHATLASQGITVGTINIDGTDIVLDADETLQTLRSKINSATDSDGKELGVNASVLKMADNNFRLVLTSTESGSEGVDYQDVTGSTLVDLGIIADTAGDKGNVAQVTQSAEDVNALFGGLALGEMIQFSGTDHNGNDINGGYVMRADSTIDDFLSYVEKRFNGMAQATIGAGGELVVTSSVAGSSQLSFDSFSMGSNTVNMNITEAGADGAGVLSVGRDAYVSVDNMNLSSSKNTIEDFITGVDINLHSVSVDKAVTVEMKYDIDNIETKVKDLINTFNALHRFANVNTTFGDVEDDSDDDKGDLAGDMTVNSIVSQFRSTFQSNMDEVNGKYTSMLMVGLKTNAQSGELELDSDTFREALETNFDDVINLFTKNGYDEGNTIVMGRNTEDTNSGRYVLEELDANHLRIRSEDGTEWYTSDSRVGDIVTWSDGPANGLGLTAPTGSLGGSSTTFVYSKGLSSMLKELADKMTDSTDGLVHMRQESWRRSIDSSNERIERLEARVDSYRDRLVRQFSAMEQTMSQLQTQSANMMAALG